MKKHVHTFNHSKYSNDKKAHRINVGLLQNGRTHSLLFASIMAKGDTSSFSVCCIWRRW